MQRYTNRVKLVFELSMLFAKHAFYFAKFHPRLLTLREFGNMPSLFPQHFDEAAENGFGDMEFYVAACDVGEGEGLLDGADAADEVKVDDVFATKPDKTELRLRVASDAVFDVAQAKGHHEVGATGVVDVRIVVVGLHIDDLGEVDDIQFVVGTQIQTVGWRFRHSSDIIPAVALSRELLLRVLGNAYIQKAGQHFSLVLQHKALACPSSQDEQRRSPGYVYSTRPALPDVMPAAGCVYDTSNASIVAMPSDLSRNLRDSVSPKTKRQINASHKYTAHPPLGLLRMVRNPIGINVRMQR